MKTIKKENDAILGEMVYLVDEKWKRNGWGKYITDTIGNRKEKILVLYDLYGYPMDFVQQQMDEKTRKRKERLGKVYQEFVKDKSKIKDVLLEELLDGCFFEELLERETLEMYRKIYSSKEHLFQETQIVEVRIHLSGYSIMVLFPWEENEIAIVNWKIFDPEKKDCFLIWEEARWLNEVRDEILGELICFASESLEPDCWGTYLKYPLFYRKEVIPIKFNLYFCSMNLQSVLDEKETIEKNKNYGMFIKNL